MKYEYKQIYISKMPLKATIYRMYGGGGDLEAGRAGYSGVVIGQKKGMWNIGGMQLYISYNI